MRVETLGHAVLLLSEKDGKPILATDPWLTGSCYWRSWWMVNYPRPDDIARIAKSRFLYLTHEHPDHFHTPSLRMLMAMTGDDRPEILLPDFLIMKMENYLVTEGWRVRRLPTRRWIELQAGVQVMSLPTWSNDSLLLVDTPDALILNVNDAKPPRALMETVGQLRQSLGKFTILLRSHSPAGPAHSYFRHGKRIKKNPVRRMRAIRNVCRRTGADVFQPFASQVVFRRPDTVWANDYRLGYETLRDNWADMGGTRLLAPFSATDLSTRETTSLPPADYNSGDGDIVRQLVEDHVAENAGAVWEEADRRRLEDQLRSIRWPLRFLLPRGFSIEADGVRMFWNPRLARVEPERLGGQFTLRLPLLPLKEALSFGHMGDLSIPMFTEIHLDDSTPAHKVDVFFMFLILRDYGYLRGAWRTLRWALWSLRMRLGSQRKLPVPS